jgi:hypothetical protein
MVLYTNVLEVSWEDNEWIDSITFLLDPHVPGGNTARLNLPHHLKEPSFLEEYHLLVEKFSLKECGLILKTGKAVRFDERCRSGQCEVGAVYPFYFSLDQNQGSIREILETLWSQAFLSLRDKNRILPSLNLFEESLDLATHRSLCVLPTQMEMIRDFARPYTRILRGEVEPELVEAWLGDLCFFWTLGVFDVNKIKPNTLVGYIQNHRKHTPPSEEDLNALIPLAIAVQGFSPLEEELEVCGVSPPGREATRSIIVSMIYG